MDLFGTRWRIEERRKYPFSSDLRTKWVVLHKFLGMFWCTCCQDWVGGNEMSDFYEDYDSLERAKRALMFKIGEKRFATHIFDGKIEIEPLKPVIFGYRIKRVVVGKECDPGYVVAKGHYEKFGANEGVMAFVTHEHVTDVKENIKELLMLVDIQGMTVDNRTLFDTQHTNSGKISDRYSNVVSI